MADNNGGEAGESIIKKPRSVLATVIMAAGFAGFLVWLYYPILGSYFANDDWVLLWYSGQIPPSEPWRYFSMHAVWFYRPLQTMQYGLTQHFAGFNFTWYAMQSLLMHIIVCGLVWIFVKLLFGRAMAWVSTVLFSVSCLAPDILLWAPNFNTLHHAIATLAAASLYLQYLRSGSRWALAGAYLMAIVNCFTKESSVNLPLVIASVWLVVSLQKLWACDTLSLAETGRRLVRGFFSKHFIMTFAPFMLIVAVYTGLHFTFFKNIEVYYTLKYPFVPVGTALKNIAFAVNFSLLGLISYPTMYKFTSLPGVEIHTFLRHAYFLAPAILAVGVWLRSPLTIFCVFLAMSLQVPTFALQGFDMKRYYYLAALCCAILLSAAILPGLRFLWCLMQDSYRGNKSQEPALVRRKVFSYLGVLLLLLVFLGNVLGFQVSIAGTNQQCAFIRQTFQYVQDNGDSLPADSLVVLRLEPNFFFNNGVGVSEMLALASGRNDLMGVTTDTDVVPDVKTILDTKENKYLLDVFTAEPSFIKISEQQFKTLMFE